MIEMITIQISSNPKNILPLLSILQYLCFCRYTDTGAVYEHVPQDNLDSGGVGGSRLRTNLNDC